MTDEAIKYVWSMTSVKVRRSVRDRVAMHDSLATLRSDLRVALHNDIRERYKNIQFYGRSDSTVLSAEWSRIRGSDNGLFWRASTNIYPYFVLME